MAVHLTLLDGIMSYSYFLDLRASPVVEARVPAPCVANDAGFRADNYQFVLVTPSFRPGQSVSSVSITPFVACCELHRLLIGVCFAPPRHAHNTTAASDGGAVCERTE